jgi:hypothetical protein
MTFFLGISPISCAAVRSAHACLSFVVGVGRAKRYVLRVLSYLVEAMGLGSRDRERNTHSHCIISCFAQYFPAMLAVRRDAIGGVLSIARLNPALSNRMTASRRVPLTPHSPVVVVCFSTALELWLWRLWLAGAVLVLMVIQRRNNFSHRRHSD